MRLPICYDTDDNENNNTVESLERNIHVCETGVFDTGFWVAQAPLAKPVQLLASSEISTCTNTVLASSGRELADKVYGISGETHVNCSVRESSVQEVLLQ
jgi:hypothetical protein